MSPAHDGRGWMARRHQQSERITLVSQKRMRGGGVWSPLTGFVLEVPYLEGPVVTAGHHLIVVLQEPGCHHSVGMTGQSVL